MEWGYSGINGPENWSKVFTTAAGSRQSPIDIQPEILNNSRINSNQKLTWTYHPSDIFTISNTGHSWQACTDNNNLSVLTGGPLTCEYELGQIHSHWGCNDLEGSEHSVNGQKYASELHLVHWNKTKYGSFQEATQYPDGLCVLGVFVKVGAQHSEFEKITEKIPDILHKGEMAKLSSPLDPNLLLPKKQGYFTYLGSLTTPPCSECVIWILFSDPIEVSSEQLKSCRMLRCHSSETCNCNEACTDAMIQNFRPICSKGDRVVLYDEL